MDSGEEVYQAHFQGIGWRQIAVGYHMDRGKVGWLELQVFPQLTDERICDTYLRTPRSLAAYFVLLSRGQPDLEGDRLNLRRNGGISA